MRLSPFLVVLLVAFGAASSEAAAQSVSSVSGAEVKRGAEFEYRAGYAREDDGHPEGFAQRFHFQYGFDDGWRGRIIVIQSKHGAEALQTRSVSLEIQKQILESKKTGGWSSAIRVEGLIPVQQAAPGKAKLAWLNTFELDARWQLRGNVYFNHSFGDNAVDGISIETREEATYKLPRDVKIGVQAFNFFNTTARFGSFDEQKHQIGPVVKGKIGKRVKYEISTLFGVSRAASDTDFRVFFGYSF
jgi:hypothetical protein